jgi:hypothetical protein
VRELEDARAALERYYSRDRLSGDAHRLHEPMAALIAAYEEEHPHSHGAHGCRGEGSPRADGD